MRGISFSILVFISLLRESGLRFFLKFLRVYKFGENML
nr:MAG TPA: hypothetical protein [Caudoviricetes sp.]